MRIKLDENVHARLAALLQQAGHEATTVRDQGLGAIEDPALYQHCLSEGNILVTLDLDFSNVLRFPPERTPGLVILRGPDNLFPTIRILIQTLISALTTDTPSGHLWIVEPGRVRIHESTSEA